MRAITCFFREIRSTPFQPGSTHRWLSVGKNRFSIASVGGQNPAQGASFKTLHWDMYPYLSDLGQDSLQHYLGN